MRRARLVSVAVLVLLLVLLPLAPSFDAVAGPAGKDFLTVALAGDVIQHPLIQSIRDSIYVNSVMFNGLVTFDPDTLAPAPDLAQSWTVTPDGKTWTFRLRRNVKWHDGAPFTAADVKFTIETMLKPEVNSSYLRPNIAGIARVRIVDDYTVVFELSEPDADLLSLLAHYIYIVPKHILEKVQDVNRATEFLNRPIGTGAFKFSERVTGDHYTVVANGQYFKGAPKIKGIVFRIIPDANTQVAQLKTGGLGFAPVGPGEVLAVQSDPNLRVQMAKQPNFWHLFMNYSKPYFKDRRVRQAFMYGLDRQTINRQTMLGLAQLAAGPVPPALAAFRNPNLKPYPYDPLKAAQLLDEAGWKVGPGGIRVKDGVPLKVAIVVAPIFAAWEEIALFAQQQWKELGIDVTVNKLETNVAVGKLYDGSYDLFMGFRDMVPSPVDLRRYYTCGAGSNTLRYCNPDVDKLLKEAQVELDAAKRRQIYLRLQEILWEDVPTVYLFYPPDFQVISRQVKDFPNAYTPVALRYLERISMGDR